MAATLPSFHNPLRDGRSVSTLESEADQSRRQRGAGHADPTKGAPIVVLRRHLAETFGTFLLVVVDCGGAVIGSHWPFVVPPAARAVATGLTILAVIHSYGDVSGAHLNPAVTLAFALRGVFPWRRVATYWLAQLAGALLGALLLRSMFGNAAHLGATAPGLDNRTAFVMEVFLTTMLVSVVLGTATRHRSLGPSAALACGGTVAVCALFSRPISGASMNPIRSLAPALVSGYLDNLWIYLTAPFLGAVIAVLITRVLHSHRHEYERLASAGEPKRA
jgi:MIP family channel proteins